MSREEFDALVTRLQTVSEQNPRAYNFRVGALAVLGYSYILGVLLVAALLTVAIIGMVIAFPNAGTIKLAIVFGAITGGISWAILKALWVRLEAPQGLELKPEDAPEIFSLLDRLNERFKGPRFHRVLLVGDYNAAVVQVPRLGVFGWQRNYLLLGLPLMQSLSPEEFEAVLAHEFGHLSGNHARFGAWIYRIRRTWERVFEEMFKQRQRGSVVLTKFLDWFWPKFNAHAFVLARVNEYEADRCAAAFSSPAIAAQALTRVNYHGALLEESFWPSLFKRVSQETEPPKNVYSQIASAFRQEPPVADGSRWLKTAFLLETNNADTHPCLKDRLRALGSLPENINRGEFPSTVPPVTETAAEKFLGPQEAVLAAKLSDTWRKNVLPLWQQRREQLVELDKEIATTATDSPTASGVEQLWRKTRALIDRDGDEGAMASVDQVLTLEPTHAAASFVRGRFLLSKDDPCGIEWIERAVAKDESLTQAGCELLYGHYSRVGQRDKLRAVENRADAFQQRTAEATRERNEITIADNFLPADLKPEVIQALQSVFAAEKDIFQVVVAKKDVRIFPEHPVLIFAVMLKVAAWKLRSDSANQQLVERLAAAMKMEDQFLVFVAGKPLKELGQKIASVPNAQIYQRSE